MKLSELLSDVEIFSADCDEELDVTQITSDSRCVLKGGLFVCIRGSHFDGHDFIADAVANGAAAVIAEDASRVPPGVQYVIVKSTRLAEAHIWNRWYSCPAEGMNVIAVTGTNGKTSTVFMLREIFKTDGRRVGIITTVKAMAGDEVLGVFGGSSVSDALGAMTTPDPEYLFGTIYLMKQRGVDTLIFEASSHALALYKIDPIRVNVAVFTNLSAEHLDFHGDMENYYSAKARLTTLAENIVINADDSYMSRLADGRVTCVACSADSASAVYMRSDVTALKQESNGLDGVEYIYFSANAVFKMKSPIPGRYTVYNTMLAGAAAMTAGASPEAVRDGIASLRSVEGRLELVDLGRDDLPFKVFIDYAHTPAAMDGLLRSVREIRKKGQRITVLFGCGGDRDRSKRRQMGMIASRLADFVIITGDNSRSEEPEGIIREILLGVDLEKPHAVIRDRRRAIEFAVREALDGEIIILAGKGHEKYEITAEGKVPFDEIQIVRDAVKKYR